MKKVKINKERTMIDIDVFLNAFSSVLKEKNKDIRFISRWASIKDEKFSAYTKFTLEVNEMKGGVITNKFTVQRTENLSDTLYCIKEQLEETVKDKMVEEAIRMMLKYYMYGELVQ